MRPSVPFFLIFLACALNSVHSNGSTHPKAVTRRTSELQNFSFPDDDDVDANVQNNKQHLISSGTSGRSNSNEIPLDLIHLLNNYTEVNDLLLNFVEGGITNESDITINSRFFEIEKSSAGAVVPKSAVCMPEMQTIKIAPDDNPSVLYIPACTRIERCGGCCSHNLLACQPKEVETVTYNVVKTEFVGGTKLKNLGKVPVIVERHLKCKCDCKIQEKDCKSGQVYRKNECRCACINTDEEKKCYKEYSTKIWNPETCNCDCRNATQCSTGFMFDILHCRCVPVPVRRRFAEIGYYQDADADVEEAPPLYVIKNTKN